LGISPLGKKLSYFSFELPVMFSCTGNFVRAWIRSYD
jgi:hypothetical protein